MSYDFRTVEFRLHQNQLTLFGTLLVQVAPPESWPTAIALPTGPEMYRILVGRNKFESRVEINDYVVWTFTWEESHEWRVEEFMYNGARWRLEYRTRWPELEA